MAVAVQAYLMPRRSDLRGERRPALHLLADEVERGGGAGIRERPQDGGSALWMRAVVEREGDTRRSLETAGNAEPRRHPRQQRKRRRP